MSARPTAVRFLRQWHGFSPGAATSQLGHGVAAMLVQRGFCNWTAPPGASSHDPAAAGSKAAANKTKRRARRQE